jgi:hypothetical protein
MKRAIILTLAALALPATAQADSARGRVSQHGGRYWLSWTLHHQCEGQPAFPEEPPDEEVIRCQEPWFEVVDLRPQAWGHCPDTSRAVSRIFVGPVNNLGGSDYPGGDRELLPHLGTRRVRVCFYVNAEQEELVGEQRFTLAHRP